MAKRLLQVASPMENGEDFDVVIGLPDSIDDAVTAMNHFPKAVSRQFGDYSTAAGLLFEFPGGLDQAADESLRIET